MEIKCEKDDFFLERYLNILEYELKKAGCKTKPPTIDQLKRSIYKRRIFSIFSGLIYFPRMMCDKSDVEEFDKVLVNGETKLDIFKNPDTSIAVRKLLKAMNEKGYLDWSDKIFKKRKTIINICRIQMGLRSLGIENISGSGFLHLYDVWLRPFTTHSCSFFNLQFLLFL